LSGAFMLRGTNAPFFKIGRVMSYIFNGFFALATEPVLESALHRWPFCRGRMIDHPFKGIGVDAALWPNHFTVEEAEAHRQRLHDFDRSFSEWTQEFPDVTFVKIWVECFGGQCDYWGYVCCNGVVLHREEEPFLDTEEPDQPLLRLLSYLGLQQDDPYFPPFERGYFDADAA
jgi:hypothetical protein